MEVPINYLAVLVSAISAMVLGFLWYGPIFGKAWMKEMGYSDQSMEAGKKSMMKSYVLMAIGAFIMAYVLAHGIAFGNAYLNMSGTLAGVQGAFWYWLGFVAPVTMSRVLWESKTWKYWLITAGYYLVSLLIMGAIISGWA